MRLLGLGVLVACLVGAWVSLVACGIGTNGLATAEDGAVPDAGDDVYDATGPIEASTEAETSDGGDEAPAAPPTCGSCGGACCGDQCVQRYCPGCDGGTILCPYDLGMSTSPGFCVASCSACAPNGSAAPVTCYKCGGGITLESCAANAGSCPQTANAGACPCPSMDAGECPGANQTCVVVDQQPICITQ